MSKPKNETEIQIPEELITELLTDSEMRMLKQRFQILKLISEKKSVRAIAGIVKVGTDTVMRMVRRLEKNEKLRNYFLTEKTASASQSKWVFGQISSEEEN